jgi:hypothetical protein
MRRGLIEEASGGTSFLGEVSDLSPAGQAKLLRALQEREIRRSRFGAICGLFQPPVEFSLNYYLPPSFGKIFSTD